MTDDPRYGIGDLAELGGVSRRTVRYYVQQGLLPAPFGVGRGNHYSRAHLNQLLKIKALQEAGRSLEEIRRALDPGRPRAFARVSQAPPPEPARALYRRMTLAPGVELHVASDVRLPPPGRLVELAAWCRLYLGASNENKEEDDD